MDMPSFHKFATRLSREETAAAASEYAIVVAFVAVAIAAAVAQFDLGNVFVVIATKVQGLLG